MRGYFIPKPDVDSLINLLAAEGYTVIGPRLEEGVVRLGPIKGLEVGIVDEQEAGYYRAKVKGNGLFLYANGPDSMKKFLWPAVEKLLRVERKKRGFRVEAAGKAADRYAFVGVRGCDVSALEVLDRVFMSDKLFVESYVKMRKSCFILAVNCTNPSSTCFCDSMGNGPEVVSGYDLLLTELGDAVLIEVGSEKGAKMVRLLGLKQAKDDMFEEKAALIERAKKGMKRHLDKEGVRRALQDSYESPVWRDVAGRCLACGNCTSVCPTCFCSDVIDRIELLDDSVERIRVWDSCFNLEFSYTAGFPIRGSITSRYRQWFSHKFGYWREQFGPFGCVGCGRCITWCPVGIDVTEVARLLPSRTPAIRR